MNCSREDELLDALTRGYVSPELSAHIAACDVCTELRAVAAALLDDRREAILEAPVPSAAAMRHRLEMRLRQDAQAAARRTLLIGQAVTLAIGVCLTYVLLGGTVATSLRAAIASVSVSTPLVLTLAVCAALAPIAALAALRQKSTRTR